VEMSGTGMSRDSGGDERHWYVEGQCARSVRVSHMAHPTTALGSARHFNLWNSSHGAGTLLRRCPSHLVQGQNYYVNSALHPSGVA